MDDFLMHVGTPQKFDFDPHGSGRYRQGSGDHAYQRAYDFYTMYKKYENMGLSETDIAKNMGVLNRYGDPSPSMLKARYSLALADVKNRMKYQALEMVDSKKMTNVEIAQRLGVTEGTVRNWIRDREKVREDQVRLTAETLKKYVEEHRYVDVGVGTNLYLNCNPNQMAKAIEMLKLEEGFHVHNVDIPQMGTDHMTTLSILTPGDVNYGELMQHRYEVKSIGDDGLVINSDGIYDILAKTEKPPAVSSDRLQIVYKEDGGTDRDGLIELRPGVDDLSMGGLAYAQVRINVDDKYYLKGMAVYNPDLPPGVDVRFNSNKSNQKPLKDVLKELKTISDDNPDIDWVNPFGASTTQIHDENGNVSAVNVVNKQGDWQDWDRNLPSQFLSKQSTFLAEQQLNQAYLDDKVELEKISSLTNPTLKRELLLQYADGCEKKAEDLKAAPIKGQQTHVLIPVPELKDNEIYAPNYPDGTLVALVRYPHGGTFEIPILTVRNTGSPAKKIISQAPDAVGINSVVAERLSGADFDGDSVAVIPLSSSVQVKSTPRLKELIGFDPRTDYPGYEGMKVMTSAEKGKQMGIVTNLIADMTLKGASPDEIARATKCSMVIIDAEKHKLDWRRCYKDCNIDELKRIYQTDPITGKSGASTIISRAKNEFDVPEKDKSRWTINDDGSITYKQTGETYQYGTLRGAVTKADGTVIFTQARRDKDTGKLYYTETDPLTNKKVRQYITDDQYRHGKVYVNTEKSTGRYYYLKTDPVTNKPTRIYVTEQDFNDNGIKTGGKITKSTRMAETDDPYTLTSGGSKEATKYPMELVYAKYATDEKNLAKQARLLYLKTGKLEYSPAANAKYKEEVEALNRKVDDVIRNAPKERQAQIIANNLLASVKKEKKQMSKDELQKYKNRYIDVARNYVGSKKKDKLIKLTDREWEAIQSGAIRDVKLRTIFQNCDQDDLKKRALPRTRRTLTDAQKQLVKSLRSSGYEAADIARRLGISPSYVYEIATGE